MLKYTAKCQTPERGLFRGFLPGFGHGAELFRAVSERMCRSMKGYNDKRRKLFIRIIASILAVLMIGTVFAGLIFR